MIPGNAAGKRLVELVKTFTFAVRAAPETLALLALITMGAGWATRMGTLPGQGHPALGALVEGMAWACLYAGLGSVYCAAASATRESVPRVFRRLGLSLLLALLSTHLCKLLSAAIVTPVTWDNLFYLKWLVPPAFAALWCAVLLPRETLALVRAARASPELAPLPQLLVLVASAAILVSCADLAFERTGGSAVEVNLKSEIIYPNAWAANVLILIGAYALAFTVTSRLVATLLLVSPVYIAFGIATLLKIRYMHSAVQPLDLVRLREFMPFIQSYFGTGVLAASAGAVGLWLIALVTACKREPCPMSPVRRWSIGILSLAVLLLFPVAYFIADSVPVADALLTFFVGRDRDKAFREMARTSGFLVSFISELPGVFVPTPPDYSPAAVANTLRKYCVPGVTPEGRGGKVNLIIYMVESFMDPDDLGFHYTSDPIPHVRALRRSHIAGYGIVPEEFGGSASSEFEALTGMTTSFLPKGSIAYRLYLKHPLPSLPRVLRGLGYATTAVQADPRYLYDRERVYPLLGFDRVVWLHEAPGVERAPRGWWASDNAVVEAVIQASQEAHPFFVFAFPSATHGPYNRGTYRDSDLDVLDLPSGELGEVKEYINTLRVADQAIGKLVEYFSHQPDSTIIAVLGDHLAPLSESAMRPFFLRLSGMSKAEQAWMLRRVPLLIWANFALPREERELSINALPSYLLEKMRISPPGFLAVSDTIGHRMPIFGSQVQGGDGRIASRASLSGDERTLVEDYRLLQYDLLLGKQYLLRDSASTGRPCI